MTGVQTCALPICFPVTITKQVAQAENLDGLKTVYAHAYKALRDTEWMQQLEAAKNTRKAELMEVK